MTDIQRDRLMREKFGQPVTEPGEWDGERGAQVAPTSPTDMDATVTAIDDAPSIRPGERHRGATPGPVSADSTARRIVETHRKRLMARRHRDATAEKYVLHVDGEGGAQWHDLYHGVRMMMVPRLRGAPRMQNNQLRPIIDNLIAHLTTQPIRFVVESRKDKDSRERALMDQLVVNHQVRTQQWNALLAEAKYVAACYGMCPIHQMVRDDAHPSYEGAIPAQADERGADPMAQGPPPIMLDAWVGNPWDTTFDAGARLWSIHRATYGRVLPTGLVRRAFGRDDLMGDKRRPSASQFQLIAQRWMQGGAAPHGTAALRHGETDEELTGLVYEEIPPGIDPDWPMGSLRIVALQGDATAQRELSRGGAGRSVLLWEGELPGGCFSFVPFYSHWRMDDPLGKPFVGDLSEDQITLNQLESLADEYLRRASRPPLASTGAVRVDSLDYNGDTLLELEPTGMASGDTELRYLEYPAQHLVFLQARIERVLEGMYRKGAYQAASRGEASSGQSGKALIAMQSADDSILGPLSMRTQQELEAFAQLSWKLLKEYLDVPMVVDIVGDELAHIAEPYVSRHELSNRPPSFRLVSGFGTSTESKAQQLLNLVQTVDPLGEPILTSRQLRQKWPDQNLFSEQDDPQEYRERHARVVNQTIERLAEEVRQQTPQLPDEMNDPGVMQAAQAVWTQCDMRHPLLMDDDIEAHIDALSLLTQDDTADAIVRHAAMFRQDQYWQWMSMQQMAAQGLVDPAEARMPPPGPGQAAQAQQQQAPPEEGAIEQGMPGRGGNNAEGMVQQDAQFEQRAQQVASA